ncbi:MAG: nitroreductase family protein [Bacteroidales bacterium]|nr:nitroreductase family protein [Bacteroidales bacterium]
MINKQAVTNEEIHPVLKNRWSPRAFSDIAVENSKIVRMFEAAQWSPSASNEQPWSFIIGLKGDETYNKIYDTLVEFNQLWAITAPILILNCGRTMSLKNAGKPNTHFMYDAGQAAAHLTFQASSDGLFVHQMAGFDAEKAAEAFMLPTDFVALTVIAVGYIGDPEELHPNLKKMEYNKRERRDLLQTVFSGNFGEPSGLIAR